VIVAPRLTIRQLMILVVLCAVACACFVPVLRADSQNRLPLLCFMVLATPLVLTIPVLVLFRSGPWKDWTINFLMALPVLVFALAANVGLGIAAVFSEEDSVLTIAAGGLIIDLFFALPIIFIARRLIPRRCPSCGRRARLRDGRPDRSASWCAACGLRSDR
jgi:hypothetical protein